MLLQLSHWNVEPQGGRCGKLQEGQSGFPECGEERRRPFKMLSGSAAGWANTLYALCPSGISFGISISL